MAGKDITTFFPKKSAIRHAPKLNLYALRSAVHPPSDGANADLSIILEEPVWIVRV